MIDTSECVAAQAPATDEASSPTTGGLMHRIAQLAIAAPRRIIALAVLLMVAAAVFGVPVAKSLSASGFQDPTSESAKATKLLTEKFGAGDAQLVIIVTS